MDEFAEKIPQSSWPTAVESSVSFPQVNAYLVKYQNPKEADAMTKIQEDLDETKIILVNFAVVVVVVVVVLIRFERAAR